MATITAVQSFSLGGTENLYWGTCTLDSSYPTGGETLDLGSNERLDFVHVVPKGGYSYEWDAANQKLIARYADYDAVADGPLIQVPNATDLSAQSNIPFIAIGN